MIRSFQYVFILLAGALLASCGSYKQNIMFRTSDTSVIKQQVSLAEKNYVIQKNDNLQLEVFTNNGERIIDPDYKLSKDLSTQSLGARPIPTYLVDINGIAKFPMVGELKAEGLTIREAEDILQKEYTKYYKEPFVTLKFINKRVVVLGAPGGQVIPLLNENVRLTEILALAKGLARDAKAHNIRVLRGQDVFVVDLTTIEGYRQYNMVMEPGDIVYVEPVRKPFVEGFQEYGPLISVITSITTLIIVLTQ